MKNLFITDFFPPPMSGGSLVFLYNLASNLPSGTASVLTVARENYLDFDKTLKYPVYRSHVPWPRRRGWRPFALAALAKKASLVVRRERPDILHCGHFNLMSGPVCWLSKRRWGLPYILYAYGEEMNIQLRSEGKSARRRIEGRILRAILREASGFVSVSDYTSGLLKQFGADPNKILKIIPMVAPRPVPAPEEVSLLRERLGLKENERAILNVSRMDPRKGQDRLIQALSKILPKVANVRLVIAGRGRYEAGLKKLVNDLGLDRNVIFTGFVAEEDMPALYEMCEVFAMPHRELANGDTEGCPTVFLEANAYGKPTLAGSAGGVRDAVLDGQTGFVVNGEDVDQIAQKLTLLLMNEELAQNLGENGRRRVLADFSPACGVEKLQVFCEAIICREGSS